MSAIEQDAIEVAGAPATRDRTLWAVPAERPPLAYDSWRRHVKRTIDIVAVVLVALAVLPLCAVIVIALKIASPGPVLFTQSRVGRDGRPFRMLKFRTMYVDADERVRADPALYARFVECDFKLPAEEDTRIVPLGRFLRTTSLDELPQLLNVLCGDMSLVGPRPVVPEEVASYGSLVDAYLRARPGLTGRWQTTGRSTVKFPERAGVDAEYLESWSLTCDLRILLKTIPCVLRRHGAH